MKLIRPAVYLAFVESSVVRMMELGVDSMSIFAMMVPCDLIHFILPHILISLISLTSAKWLHGYTTHLHLIAQRLDRHIHTPHSSAQLSTAGEPKRYKRFATLPRVCVCKTFHAAILNSPVVCPPVGRQSTHLTIAHATAQPWLHPDHHITTTVIIEITELSRLS